MQAPLKGIKVLELARVLAGPWCGQILADLGADVVKVERTGLGDDTRHWGPPFVEGADGEPHNSAYFNSCNRGKRSIAADFETDEGRALIRKLASHADILIENFKVGGLKKFGLDYEALKKINPRLIYCSITGFGQDGPYAPRAGYDLMVQGLSGLMDITGDPDGPPMKAGNPPVDLFTGTYSAVGILAALHRRAETGEGAYLDMALLDTQLSALGGLSINYLVTGKSPKRMGNAHPSIVPYETVPVKGGYAMLACGNDIQFDRLCKGLGMPEWAEDERFKTNKARVANRATLMPMLTAKTAAMTRDAFLKLLDDNVVAGGPINSIAEVFENPQVIHRAMQVNLPDATTKKGEVPLVRSPFMIDGQGLYAKKPPPKLGADGQSVLRDPEWGGASA